MRNNYLLLTVLLFASSCLYAQEEYPITDGQTVTTCSGTFVDDGIEFPYTGASHTFAICPDIPGNVVQIEFQGFNLQTSPNPNNNDVLSIFQGPDASFPSGGNYSGTQLDGLVITGNTANTSGCLTFVFSSPTGNTAGLPGWLGFISCTTPCDAPTQVSQFTSPVPPVAGLDSVSLCIGDVVSFSGAGSVAAPGFTLDEYQWNFDDGSPVDVTSGVTANHTFTEAGQFLVTLNVSDNNGCQSPNITPLQVIVSTLPEIIINYPTESCIGEEFDISSSATGITWTSLPPQVVSGETYLADDLGFDFNSTLSFDFFETGQTLDDCNDLEQININMEHSYLGDLEMIITCPDGTSVTLHEFGSGGGGTYLGEAVDPGTVPGTGYDYGWSPTSTIGFFYEAGNSGPVSYTDNAGNNVNPNVVNPGIYESQNDLCALVGCPLNGTWTFTVTDNLGIDDGYIFEWGIDFNPELFPDVTTFTPIWGQEADSSSWNATGSFITNTSSDANTITVAPTSSGDYDYTFTTLNNFGCAFDTTITISVLEPIDINAGMDENIQCEEAYTLSPFINATPFDDCEYELVLVDNWANGWSGGEVELIIDGVSSTYTSITGEFTNFDITIPHNASVEIYYTPGAIDVPNNQDPSQNEYYFYNGNGVSVFQDGEFGVAPVPGLVFSGNVYCFPPEPALVYSWSPPEFLNNPNSQNPTLNGVVETTTFTVEVWQANHPDCVFTDEVTLTVLGALSAGEDIAQCTMSYQLDASVIANGEWSAPAGAGLTFSAPTAGNSMVTGTIPGTYTLTWTDLDGLTCPISQDIDVTFFDGVTITPTLTQPTCYGLCDGEIEIDVVGGSVAPGTNYVYTFTDGTTIGTSANEIINLCTGYYDVVVQDNYGCGGDLDFFLNQPPLPVIDSIGSVRESCFGFCDGTLTVYSSEADEYSYDGGFTYGTDSENSTLCGGEYNVVIKDPNGCQANMEAFVTSPTPPNALFAADPVRTSLFDPLIAFTNFSSGNLYNDWIFGIEQEAGTSQEENPSFYFPNLPGIYTVELTITDSIGCIDSTRIDIEILDEFMVFVPTAFSPNDDGINDLFHLEITDLDLTGYLFQVFDRFGSLVFETTEYPTTWNGQGADNESYYVADGVYVWRLKAESASTTERVEKMGMITVIR